MPITFQNVCHTYMPNTNIEKLALKDISFDILSGDSVAIMGQTGSGKSTLVQHCNGLLKPSCGVVTVEGVDSSSKNFAKVRKHIGFVMQYPEHQLFGETVYKDIAFVLRKHNLSINAIEKRVHEVAELVGLDKNILNIPPFELSGGQKRKVAIAGVLASKPHYLILDEPTVGLDSEAHNVILNLIQTLNQDCNMTIILVSHNIEDIIKVAKRIFVLHQGCLEIDIKICDIFDHEKRLNEIGLLFPPITYLMKYIKKSLIPQIDHRVLTVNHAKEQLIKFLLRGLYHAKK